MEFAYKIKCKKRSFAGNKRGRKKDSTVGKRSFIRGKKEFVMAVPIFPLSWVMSILLYYLQFYNITESLKKGKESQIINYFQD